MQTKFSLASLDGTGYLLNGLQQSLGTFTSKCTIMNAFKFNYLGRGILTAITKPFPVFPVSLFTKILYMNLYLMFALTFTKQKKVKDRCLKCVREIFFFKRNL